MVCSYPFPCLEALLPCHLQISFLSFLWLHSNLGLKFVILCEKMLDAISRFQSWDSSTRTFGRFTALCLSTNTLLITTYKEWYQRPQLQRLLPKSTATETPSWLHTKSPTNVDLQILLLQAFCHLPPPFWQQQLQVCQHFNQNLSMSTYKSNVEKVNKLIDCLSSGGPIKKEGFTHQYLLLPDS